MPRQVRQQPGGVVFHVLNRGNERRELFAKPADYDAFLKVLAEVHDHVPMRLLAYCLMPNHWHLLLWPQADGDMGRFMQRLTVTHVHRWRAHRQSVGYGHLYQGTYKSFPIEEDRHFLLACRYVEANALRAGLVARAEDWPWSSLAQRGRIEAETGNERPVLAAWPVKRPRNWVEAVNRGDSLSEIAVVRTCLQRGRPLGSPPWVSRTVDRLGLTHTLRSRGRPRKTPASDT